MSGTQTAVFDAEALGIVVTRMGELFLIARRPPNNEQPSPDGLQGVRGDGDGEEVCEHEPQKLGDFLFSFRRLKVTPLHHTFTRLLCAIEIVFGVPRSGERAILRTENRPVYVYVRTYV